MPLIIIIQLLVLLLLPPLLIGVIARVKAICAGRRGAPLLQPYYDLLRLFRKNFLVSKTTSWIFLAGPIVGFVAIVLAGLFVPMAGAKAPISCTGDVIILLYLFGLARFFTASAALDTGSPFEGMGAAREVSFSCYSEPALLLGFIALSRLSGTFSLSTMFGDFKVATDALLVAPLLLIGISWFVVLLAENCRIPFDDPTTHLELTMIHEVMVLDHSGPPFGIILYSAAIKLLVTSSLLANLIVGRNGASLTQNLIFFVTTLFAIAIVTGIVESTMARLRLMSVPRLLVTAGVLSGFGMLLVMR